APDLPGARASAAPGRGRGGGRRLGRGGMSAGASIERAPEDACAGLCVLASGSRGNCTVLVHPGSPRRVTLIDAGLSPLRTRKLLHERGIEPHEVDELLLTHLDTDHCHPGWASALRTRRWHATVRIAERHMGRAGREGLLTCRTEPFGHDRFSLGEMVVDPIMLSHDDLGVAAFRFAIPGAGGVGVLGFATDLGRVTPGLIEHFARVDVLAIESNYCPQLQVASNRPAFLKKRIMGGSGHLSNEESAGAVARMSPRDRVVALHLSRECNRPDLVERAHGANGVALTITDQFEPTGWVWVRARERAMPEVRVVMRTGSLFGGARGESVA
ncbi:MAG: MBL fold metallo-hydrolase, partial [Phycisphaerales bacterium]